MRPIAPEPAHRLATLALGLVTVWVPPAVAGSDWLPPRPVSVVVPSATLAPSQPRTLEFLIRAHGAPASLKWIASAAGDFITTVSPTQGTVSLAADQSATVALNLTVPAAVTGSAIGSVYIKVLYNNAGQGWAINPEARIALRAATNGRPEVIPVPSTWTSGAGTAGNVTFQLHSMTGSAEDFGLSLTRQNPDPNNPGMKFLGGPPTSPVTLPGGGTVTVSVPTTLPGNTFPGDLNSLALVATSVSDPLKGIADATGNAFVATPHPDSLPTAFAPVGLVRQEQAVSGRDGPVPVPGRGLYLLASGGLGVRVLRDSSLNQVGTLDLNNNGLDDRLVGRIHVPAYAASMAVIPGFVSSAMGVLDLGLLACGNAGLMLVDLRDIVEPWFGTWADFYDVDGNGIDDRILRMIPVQGFATDVEWFPTPNGRVVALVAAADTGSTPVAANYNPFLVVPGTGAGVVAIDVGAALDSLPDVPFMAGTQPTSGSALDLELRGGPAPDLAVAEGANSVSFWTVDASGTPATVTFTPQASVTLASTWGTALARDLAWVPTTLDSSYLAVAASAAGVQIVKAPRGDVPYLAIVQRTEAAAIGIASTVNGNIAAAMGAAGATLLKLPPNPQLDQIDPAASPPYQAPVTLDVNAPWPYAQPLRLGTHGTVTSSITSLRFAPATSGIPDVLCADGTRTLALRPGYLAVVGVPASGQFAGTPGVRLLVTPNPVRAGAELRLMGPGSLGFAAASREPVTFEIVDLQGRVVRRLPADPSGGAVGLLARADFDGRDQGGHPLGSGRYWARARQRGGGSARAAFLVLR